MNRISLISLSCLLAFTVRAAYAQELAGPSDAPIEITAEQSLEWHEDTMLYIANSRAKAIKGHTTITADKLKAHQRPGKTRPKTKDAKDNEAQIGPNGDIDWMKAEGHVHIFDETQQIFGTEAVYNLDSQTAKVTGNNLKYQTEFDVVTARDALVYDDTQGRAMAYGKAQAVHQKTADDRRQIEGDVLTAIFSVTPDGKKEISRLNADGHVTVLTKTDISRGDHAVYDLKANNAVLTGHVKITHGTTQLSGAKAVSDFATGESHLLKEENDTRRARALIPPRDKTAAPSQTGSAP